MLSANLLIQARRSAGLSQRELAARAGVAQQEIARYERGRVTPSLERLRALIAACDLELTVGLARADDSYDGQIAAALALDPAARLGYALRDAQPLRAARAQAARARPPQPPDVLNVLRALARAGVRYVLVGQLAEVLHGSPLLPVTETLEIVPRAGERKRLGGAIGALGGKPTMPSAPPAIDALAGYVLQDYGLELLITPAPVGTWGFDDLRRDATEIRLDQDLEVVVASLIDLTRIAEASADGARVPALRRTLELTSAPPTAHAA